MDHFPEKHVFFMDQQCDFLPPLLPFHPHPLLPPSTPSAHQAARVIAADGDLGVAGPATHVLLEEEGVSHRRSLVGAPVVDSPTVPFHALIYTRTWEEVSAA